MKTRYYALIIALLLADKVYAQNWTPWETLTPGVQISFKISTCGSNPTVGKYLIGYSFYRTNNQVARDKTYVRGNFSWLDCEGEMHNSPFTIDLSESGIDDNRGQWFMGWKVVGVDDVELIDYNEVERKEKGQLEEEENIAEVNQLVANGDSYYSSHEYDQAISQYNTALTYRLSPAQKTQIESKVRDTEREKKNAEEERQRREAEEKEAEASRLAEEDRKREVEQTQEKSSQPAKTAEQIQQENFQALKDANNEAQRIRDDQLKLETATQVASMGVLGVFIFQNIGPEYDKETNIFRRGSWRFNFSLGYSFANTPIYENTAFTYSTINSSTITESTRATDIQTLNLDLGLQYWLFYSKFFGIGITGDGTAGYFPASGGGQTIYSFGIGGKLFFGSSPIKLVAAVQTGGRGFIYASTYSAENTSSDSYGLGMEEFTRFSGGIRFGFNTASSIGNLELLYIQEHYPYLKQISSKGFGITFYAHNRIKIQGELLLDGVRIGDVEFQKENGLKNTGKQWKVTVSRSMDWFGQRNK